MYQFNTCFPKCINWVSNFWKKVSIRFISKKNYWHS